MNEEQPRVTQQNPIYTEGDYTYIVRKDGATIIGFNTAFAGTLSINDRLGDIPVTGIYMDAFKNCAGITVVMIPESIVNIPCHAFVGCSNLKEFMVVPENPRYSSQNGVLFDRELKELVLFPPGREGTYTTPPGVTTIGFDAFADCARLYDIRISPGVKEIRGGAFFGCSHLSRVSLPAGLARIGDSAFGCSALGTVDIPASVTEIGKYAFADCGQLTSIKVDPANPNYTSTNEVLFDKQQTTLIQCSGAKQGAYTIPSTVLTICERAFMGCARLTGVTITTGVTFISELTFYKCGNLRAVTIPSGVRSIGYSAFAGCSRLANVGIPASVTRIESGAFEACGLVAITVDPANPNYLSENGVLFDKARTTLIKCPQTKQGSYAIPTTVRTIADGAFALCADLTAITIPDSVTAIGVRAFMRCSGLTSITFPANLMSIGAYAFAGCNGLTTVYIPAKTTVDLRSFTECAGITSFDVAAGNPKFSSLNGVLFYMSQVLFLYPAALAGPYTIPEGVLYIANRAFYKCQGLSQLTVPASVTTIYPEAFAECPNLTDVTFLGDAPAMRGPVFDPATQAKVSFCAGKRGWTTSGLTSQQGLSRSCVEVIDVCEPENDDPTILRPEFGQAT